MLRAIAVPGYRWYVGYGADYMPACNADLANFRDYPNQVQELMESLNSDYYKGKVVIKYRS